MNARVAMLVVLLAQSAWCGAQNLVPNGSFEEYTECPQFAQQLTFAPPWSVLFGTPDYFNACCTTSYVGVPQNFAGSTYAAEGNAYLGLQSWAFGDQTMGEKAQVALSSPLEVGTPVYVSFKVIPATGGSVTRCMYSSSGFGLRFSTVPLDWTVDATLPNDAVAYLTQPLEDTLEWTTVSTVYVPDSAYAYLSLGTFFEYGLVEVVEVDPNGTIEMAYVMIDQVCVSSTPGVCDGFSGVHNILPAGHRIMPNPFTDKTSLIFEEATTASTRLAVLDVLGREHYAVEVPVGCSSWEISAHELPVGELIAKWLWNGELFRTARITHLNP